MFSISKRNVYYACLFFLLILHFGVFEQSHTNPVGVKFVSELYLAICLGFTLLLLTGTPAANKQDYNMGLAFCLFSTAVFVVLPAIFSKLFYGQPLQYGLIEERRVLYCFSFFAMLYFAKRVTATQFENLVLAIGLLSVVLSWLSFFGILPDMREQVLDLSRPGRASPGAAAIIMSYCLSIYFMGRGQSPIDGAPRRKIVYAGMAFVFLATIVFVMQTRQVLVVCFVFTLLCLKSKTIMPMILGSLAVFPILVNPHLLDGLGLNLDFYMQSVEEGPTDNVRETTIAAIMNHLDQYNWVPSGSLSLMWNNGFKQYFSNYFFLSDVGVIGTLFRFGFLTFIIVPVALFVHYKAAVKLSPNLEFTLIFFLANLTMWPLQGIFEYQAPIAFLLVVQALKTHHQKMATAQELPAAVSYPYAVSHTAMAGVRAMFNPSR
jgi:hypothetical protein